MDHQPVATRERAALGQRRVEQNDQRHLFACRAQLLRHFIGGDAAARETTQEIGAVRLDLAQFGDHVARGLGQIVMGGSAAIEATRLKPVKGPILAQEMRQMPQVQHIAKHARDEEEGRFRPAFAPVHRHQMGKTALRFLWCGGVLSRLLRPDLRLDQRGTGADGGGLEQDRDGQIDAVGLADHAKKADGDQGMTTKVKE